MTRQSVANKTSEALVGNENRQTENATGQARLWPALAQSTLALLMLLCTIFLIGPAAMQDPALIEEIARANPLPIVMQDVLKLLSALCLVGLVHQWRFLDQRRTIKVAVGFRLCCFLAQLLLACNAVFSLAATTGWFSAESIGPIRLALQVTGMLSLILSAPWHGAVAWLGWRYALLQKKVAAIGLLMSLCCLIPIFGFISLLLSIAWFPLLAISLRAKRGN